LKQIKEFRPGDDFVITFSCWLAVKFIKRTVNAKHGKCIIEYAKIKKGKIDNNSVQSSYKNSRASDYSVFRNRMNQLAIVTNKQLVSIF